MEKNVTLSQKSQSYMDVLNFLKLISNLKHFMNACKILKLQRNYNKVT